MAPKIPKWRQIADELAAQITAGTLAPGAQLPHIQELVRQGKGATATVHRAYQTLEAEGLVRTTRGRGTTVLTPDEAPRSAVTGVGRLARLRRTGQPLAHRENYVDQRTVLRSCADVEVATLLNIELRDEIVLRTRTFVSGDTPTILAMNVIHMRALVHLPELLEPGPMPKWRHDLYLERTGKEITPGPERRRARLASTDELEKFGIDVPEDVPVPVLVLRTLFSDDEGPLELWEDIYRPGMDQVEGS
jgi:GntR family transcriptional regulator